MSSLNDEGVSFYYSIDFDETRVNSTMICICKKKQLEKAAAKRRRNIKVSYNHRKIVSQNHYVRLAHFPRTSLP